MKELEAIQKKLAELASEEARNSIRKFVPGSQKIYGVTMPVINEMARELKNTGTELVPALWNSGFYEERILAAKLIGKMAKKDPVLALEHVKNFSKDISDWAVCDTLGMQSLKPIAQSHREQIFRLAQQLNRSQNLWQRRLSLVLVEVYTKNKDLHHAVNALVIPLEKDREYYVAKAVAWIKRNMAKHITQ